MSCCKLDERAEAGELGDLAGDEVADLVELVDVLPRIGRELLHADGDALVGLVDFEHDGLDFVALLEHFGGVVDLAGPGHVGDVDHAVDAFFEFDEGAVAGEVADLALDVGAGRVFLRRTLSHGLGSSWRRPREIFCSSLLMPSTTASISWSGLSTSEGLAMRLVQDSSVTWTRPSTPGSSSTNAP